MSGQPNSEQVGVNTSGVIAVMARRAWGAARARGMAAALLGAVLLAGAAGCSHSLFKRGVHRSQFETYDSVRNRHESDSYEDEFGRRRINLRGRLLQNE